MSELPDEQIDGVIAAWLTGKYRTWSKAYYAATGEGACEASRRRAREIQRIYEARSQSVSGESAGEIMKRLIEKGVNRELAENICAGLSAVYSNGRADHSTRLKYISKAHELMNGGKDSGDGVIRVFTRIPRQGGFVSASKAGSPALAPGQSSAH